VTGQLGRLLLLLLVLVIPDGAWAAPVPESLPACTPTRVAPGERELYLLTMSPGDSVWNVFGHTALWVRASHGRERVYNFGVISDSADQLMSRFLLGTLDFRLAVRSFEWTSIYYTTQDRTVVAQRLDLTDDQATRLLRYLDHQSLPANAEYRYHWITANCSTRLRDAIDEAVGGQLEPQLTPDAGVSPRDGVLRHLAQHPLVWFGWHFAVGSSANRHSTWWEATFLPDRMFEAFETLEIEVDDEVRPLISESCELRRGGNGFAPPERPRFAASCWLLGLAIGLALLLIGTRRSIVARVLFGLAVVLVGLVSAVLGGMSAWLWLESGYVGFHRSPNLLVANPLSLLLVAVGVAAMRRSRRALRLALIASLPLTTAGLAALLFSLGSADSSAIVGAFLPLLVAIPLAIWIRWRCS